VTALHRESEYEGALTDHLCVNSLQRLNEHRTEILQVFICLYFMCRHKTSIFPNAQPCVNPLLSNPAARVHTCVRLARFGVFDGLFTSPEGRALELSELSGRPMDTILLDCLMYQVGERVDAYPSTPQW